MNDRNAETETEVRLREHMRRQAPRPSAAHNAAIMDAAKARAAHTRRDRMVERNRTWTGIGIAAAVLLAVGVWQSAPDAPTVDNPIRGGTEEAMPANNAVLSEAPASLSWTAQAGATRYKVKIHDDGATQLWESEWIDTTTITLPADVRLAAGARYFWVVEVNGTVERTTIGPYWFAVE